MNYSQIQENEAATWLMDDPKLRAEKAMRERIRYPYIAKQMGLNYLDTSDMEVWDIGCGPLGGVSSVLNCRKRVCVDPLAKEYGKYFETNDYLDEEGENLKDKLANADLVIVTNALDHFRNPRQFLKDLGKHMKPSGYFAHFHAIDNAISHPHPAHEHNVNPRMFKDELNADFEECWYLDYPTDGITYAWLKQPAFCGLYRKVTGYGK